jgi:hypothetical protein
MMHRSRGIEGMRSANTPDAMQWSSKANPERLGARRIIESSDDRAQRTRLRAEYWSNADSSHPNIGRNMALICYRF